MNRPSPYTLGQLALLLINSGFFAWAIARDDLLATALFGFVTGWCAFGLFDSVLTDRDVELDRRERTEATRMLSEYGAKLRRDEAR